LDWEKIATYPGFLIDPPDVIGSLEIFEDMAADEVFPAWLPPINEAEEIFKDMAAHTFGVGYNLHKAREVYNGDY
jgi:hypothetical protein